MIIITQVATFVFQKNLKRSHQKKSIQPCIINIMLRKIMAQFTPMLIYLNGAAKLQLITYKIFFLSLH